MNDDGQLVPTKVISRDQLSTDEPLQGPMLVIEDQTTTVVPSRFAFHLDARGHVVMESVER